MKPRVLLVEDNEANRYLATFVLEKAGMEVTHAANGRLGVALARELRPDLIVMDLEMPEMDGYEAATLLRADPVTSHIPVVAATSYAQAGDRAKAAAIGFADYIEKPYAVDDFINRVKRLLPSSSP